MTIGMGGPSRQKPPSEYPFGLRDEFDRIAEWAPYVKPGNWPDPDMLPEGYLGPHPGKDQPRQSALHPRRAAH